MQCAACTRTEAQRNGAWYCQSCISSRLKEYNVKRQQLRNNLTLVTANATALLTGSNSRLGVEHERLLKAEKWTLASRAYAAREQITRTKAQNQPDTEQLQQRRQRLAARRANLATAHSLLANLETDLPSASSLSLPLSVPALRARCASLQLALDTLALETARTRSILSRELVAVYALRRIIVEQPLPDPFLSAPLAESTTLAAAEATSPSPFFDPSSTLAATLRTRPPPAPIEPTYLLASLPLPKLSQLLSSSPGPAAHTHTEALLSHLVHLIRLLALYEGVSLPFNPLPSCFGPGRAGVRVAVGWGDPRGGGAIRGSASRDSDRSTPTPTPTSAQPTDPPAGPILTISDGDCFPVCYSSTTTRSKRRLRPHSRNRTTLNHAELDEEPRKGESTATDEGSDSGAVNDGGGGATTVFGGGGGARRRKVGPMTGDDTRGKGGGRGSRSSSKRAKGVLLGAVALAYDLAYLAWRREQRAAVPERQEDGTAAATCSSHPSQGDWNAPEVLDDLGELLMRAAEVALESASSARQPDPKPPRRQQQTSAVELDPATGLSRTSAAFPLSYTTAAAYFLDRVFPQQQQGWNPAAAPSGSDSLGESGVVVGLVQEEEEEDDDDDDEWDLVSV